MRSYHHLQVTYLNCTHTTIIVQYYVWNYSNRQKIVLSLVFKSFQVEHIRILLYYTPILLALIQLTVRFIANNIIMVQNVVIGPGMIKKDRRYIKRNVGCLTES